MTRVCSASTRALPCSVAAVEDVRGAGARNFGRDQLLEGGPLDDLVPRKRREQLAVEREGVERGFGRGGFEQRALVRGGGWGEHGVPARLLQQGLGQGGVGLGDGEEGGGGRRLSASPSTSISDAAMAASSSVIVSSPCFFSSAPPSLFGENTAGVS